MQSGIMKKIPLVNTKKVVLVDDDDFAEMSQLKWYLHSGGYAHSVVNLKGKRKSVYMHRLIVNPKKKMCVDHRNRVRLDNQRKNLRECTYRQNSSHAIAHDVKGRASPFKGVRLDKRTNRWNAMIRGGTTMKRHYLGTYHGDREAAAAYNGAAIILHGRFAILNSL